MATSTEKYRAEQVRQSKIAAARARCYDDSEADLVVRALASGVCPDSLMAYTGLSRTHLRAVILRVFG